MRRLAALRPSWVCGSPDIGESERFDALSDMRREEPRRLALKLGGLPPSVTNFNKDEATGSCSIYCRGDRVDLLFDHTPVIRAQDEHCHSTTGKILLIVEFLVSSDEQVEARRFSRGQ